MIRMFWFFFHFILSYSAPIIKYQSLPGYSVINSTTPGSEDNKYGYEDGIVRFANDMYHLFVSEEIGDPHWVKMRFGYWVSMDGLNWTRVSTLYESSGNSDGTDPRAALWAPVVYYNDMENFWYMTYVSYYSQIPNPPNTTGWYGNYNGQIWLAKSKANGIDGIGGPYEDIGIILKPDENSQSWEGLQGTDSFYAYNLVNQQDSPLVAFYGSAQTQNNPITGWFVGLAQSADPGNLTGPWTRLPNNPILLNDIYSENPIVTYIPDQKIYIAVMDAINNESNGFVYSWSSDGLIWTPGQLVTVPGGVRAPLGLIYGGEGSSELKVWYTDKDASGYDALFFVLCSIAFQ